MLNLGRWRIRHGVLCGLLGSALTLLLLALTDQLGSPLRAQEGVGGSSDSGRWAAAGRRDLRNLACPCGGSESREQQQERDNKERSDMMKLMKLLMEKLNRSLDQPLEQSQHLMKQDVIQGASSLDNSFQKSFGTPPIFHKPHTTGPRGVGAVALNPAYHFRSVVTSEQKQALYVALLKLSEVCKQHGYTWMLYSGTLLGSFRHHDMVPWDDDFDIFMNSSQRESIVATLSNMQPDFHLFEAGSRLKFWTSEGTLQSSKYPWKWPYLDISFYKENKTHIWDGSMEDDYGDRLYVYRKDIVFPLHLRPMGRYFFPAPRDSYQHLQLTYKAGGLGMCWTTHYSHKNESLTEGVHKIMCSELKHIYPFVHRTRHSNGVMETLRLDVEEIHHLVVDEPKYAITDPYSIKLIAS